MLGASNLTYAEATWTQALPDWTGAHVRMFRFFGGAPKRLVPDNLKSGVAKASFYDPEINRTYGAMAALRRYPAGAATAAEGQGEGFILHPVRLMARRRTRSELRKACGLCVPWGLQGLTARPKGRGKDCHCSTS